MAKFFLRFVFCWKFHKNMIEAIYFSCRFYYHINPSANQSMKEFGGDEIANAFPCVYKFSDSTKYIRWFTKVTKPACI